MPAAGRSARMGSPKLLLPWNADGTTVIETVLKAWRGSAVERIVVTVHPDDVELADLCRRCGAEVVVPETPPPDMKASTAAGLEHLRRTATPGDRDAWLVAPADLPLLTTATIDRVIAAHDPARPSVLRPVCGGKAGHPALFPWPLAAEVSQLGPSEGLHTLVERRGCREIACEQDCTAADLDTPEDYRRLHNRHLHDNR